MLLEKVTVDKFLLAYHWKSLERVRMCKASSSWEVLVKRVEHGDRSDRPGSHSPQDLELNIDGGIGCALGDMSWGRRRKWWALHL